MRSSRIRQFLVVVLVIGTLGVPIFTRAQDTLHVDMAATLRAARPTATGFTGGWTDSIPDSLITLIRPSSLRWSYPLQTVCPTPYVVPGGWTRSHESELVAQTGAARICLLVGPYCWVFPDSDCTPMDTCPPFTSLIHPDSVATWARWVDYLHLVIPKIKALRDSLGIATVGVNFFNEANLCNDWPCTATAEQFYETWKATRDTVLAIDPDMLFIGPGFAGVMLDPSDLWWTVHQDSVCVKQNGCDEVLAHDRPTLRGFLRYCDSVSVAEGRDIFPDIIDWHSSYPSDVPTEQQDLLAEVRRIKQFLHDSTTGYAKPDTLFAISEALNDTAYMVPGKVVWHFARAERAVPEGLLWMGRTVFLGNNHNERLNELIKPFTFKPRLMWWVYREYAEITGQYVSVEAGDAFDGVAGFDASTSTARLIAGRFRTTGPESLLVSFEHLDSIPGLVQNDIVQLTLMKFPGNWSAQWDSLETEAGLIVPAFSHRYLVSNGRLDVLLNGAAEFDTLDAVSFTLTPPDFQTRTAAQ